MSAVESDLELLDTALAESAELREVTRNPELSRKAQGEAIAAVAVHLGLSDLTKSFLGVLAGNRRLSALGDMIRAFQMIAAAQRGEVTAEVTSAHALSEDQLSVKEARRILDEDHWGLEEVKDRIVEFIAVLSLKPSVNPDLLGGLVVTIGSQRIDGSIRTRLNSLANAMKG